MAPNLREIASIQEWQSTFPYLDKATLQLVYPHLRNAALRLHLYPLLKNSSLENYSNELWEMFFKSPARIEDRTIMVLADIVVALLFSEKIIPGIIDTAVDEIEEAYRVILQKGSGWSSDRSKSTPDKRKTAVLEWYRRNQARLSYLKETYLQDSALYEDRGGQEKRNFKARLLIKIIKHVVKEELTFQKVGDHLKNLKKSK